MCCGWLLLGCAQAAGAAPGQQPASASANASPSVQPVGATKRVPLEQWQRDAAPGGALLRALADQGYKNVRVEVRGHVLNLTLSHQRIGNLGRAVGRAARIALPLAPSDARTIRIVYTKQDQAVATYEFFDLGKLDAYLAGGIDRATFLDVVLIRYPDRDDIIEGDRDGMLAAMEAAAGPRAMSAQQAQPAQFSIEDRETNRLRVAPKVEVYFDSPGGTLRYQAAVQGNYDRRLAEGLYLNGALGLSLFDNMSDAAAPATGTLAHVRSDVGAYRAGGRLKLQRLLLSQYLNPTERVYARASAGLYDEMYRGLGGQVLYLPATSSWAADLSVDALQQRGVNGWLDKRDYNTVTALGSLHYRLPYGVVATARGGRFLAKDKGGRLELKRRFQSGMEIGAWYTRTKGDAPGYHSDSGVFLSFPLYNTHPSDAQAPAGLAIAPWARDAGQMVTSPGDLYAMLEQPRRDMLAYDGLGDFAERADEQRLAAVNPPAAQFINPWSSMRARLEASSSALPTPSNWLKGTGLAAGAVLVASLSDKRVDRFAQNHVGSRESRTLERFGNALPYALVGAAGAAFALGDERLQNTGLISLQSALAATAVAMGGKYAIGRARPDAGRGSHSQVGDGQSRSSASFPSAHAAAAFAAVTPFAKEYDAPWLYGVAALGSAGRVMGRKHWFSDAVAGGILGYAAGGWLWQSQRHDGRSALAIIPGPKEISVTWQKTY